MSALAQKRPPPIGTCRSRPRAGMVALDPTQEDAIDAFIAAYQPQVVFLAAALADVDRCEREPDASFAINARAPALLAHSCAMHGTRLVFFSTDYVFDGTAGPALEEAPPAPINVYGRHKVEGELAVLRASPSNLVIRTSLVIGRRGDGTGFLDAVQTRLRRGERVDASADHFNSPTCLSDLVTGAIRLVEANLSGIRHVAGPETLSRFEIARRIAASQGADPSLVRACAPIQFAPRPRFVGLLPSSETCRVAGPFHRLEHGLKAP